MRILSISGQNIASLAQPFVIDFTAAPLAGAGLFAITGETGAGKSSILDAMCLALYGDAPRLAGGAAADEVPDPSGEAIKARDSRAILRRGAVQGWAEVRFTARDGQDYIARWQARRARDRADGRLQGVSRSLARAADGQVLASQTTAVTEQIVALTGLSYEEFRRTVLLAQGDFDAFLRADTNDRAGLLEKVTGTGLYREVSIRIYERTEASRQAHEALVQRRAGHQLLSDADRAALETERLALAEANQASATQASAVQGKLARHTRHAEAVRLLALAEAQELRALADQAQAGAERDRLSRIDRAEPLRAPWLAARTAEGHLAAAKEAVDAAIIVSAEARAKAIAQQELSARANADLAAKETEFKALGPAWDQAADLDSRIISAGRELEDARAQGAKLDQAAQEAHDAWASLQQDEAGLRNALSAAEAGLSGLAPDCALADDWPQIRQRIADHAEARQAADQAEAGVRQNGARAADLEQELADLATRAGADGEAETALVGQAATLGARIAAIEAAHPPGRGADLSVLASALSDMARAESDHSSALAEILAAGTGAGTAAELAAAATAGIAAADDALALAEAKAQALAAPAGRADLAASEAARELRLRLEPGQPCPVCGSCDHPTHADAALADLAASLRSDLAAARQAAEAGRAARAEAQRQHDRAQAQAEQARSEAAKAGDRRSTALSRWAEAQHRAQAVATCPALPGAPGEAPGGLAALAADIATAQQDEAAAQAELVGLRRELSEAGTRRDSLRTTLAGHATAREGLNADLFTTRGLHALALREAEVARSQADRLAAALAPTLASLHEAPPDDPALTTRLAARIARVVALREAREKAATGLASLAPRITAAESRAEGAAVQARQTQDAATVRKATLDTLCAERAPLLGGEATALHRSRHNEERLTALAAQDTTSKALASAVSAASAAHARAEAAEVERARAGQVCETAHAALGPALAASGLMEADLAALFSLPVAEVEALRQRLRALDDAVTSARATLASRRQDQAEILAAGLPDEPPEALTETLAMLEADTTTRGHRIGAIDGEFRRDAATRASLAGLEAEIAVARAELDVWQAVNHAVGSRNGDRFARVAQSITLDLLVDHANRHLADLNPRYLLRRAADLALQVEDRDMGGEARATRSLSGGERFLVSLALALALSRMGGKGGLAATLFIDEGFGSLDTSSLDLALDALESLQSQGRQVGVISHVEAMKDRIPTRIAVRKQGGGKSVVEIGGTGFELASD